MRSNLLFHKKIYIYVIICILCGFTAAIYMSGQYLQRFTHDNILLARSERIWHTDGKVFSLLFSPNGQMLASVETLTQDEEHPKYAVRLREINTGNVIHTLESQDKRIFSLAFSHSGDILATGGQDSRVQLWRIADGTLISTMDGHSGPVQQVIFAPDDKTLLSVSNDYTIRRWNVPSGTPEEVISWSTYYNCGIANAVFSGGNPHFAVREVSTIRIHSFPDKDTSQELQGFERGNCADFERVDIKFNNQATLLATVDAFAGSESLIRIWDLSTNKVRTELRGHTDRITSLAFSHDSQLLASASGIPYFALHTTGDLSIRVWRVSDGEPIAIFDKAHYGAIVGLAFSPDSYTLASGGVDGAIQFWQIP